MNLWGTGNPERLANDSECGLRIWGITRHLACSFQRAKERPWIPLRHGDRSYGHRLPQQHRKALGRHCCGNPGDSSPWRVGKENPVFQECSSLEEIITALRGSEASTLLSQFWALSAVGIMNVACVKELFYNFKWPEKFVAGFYVRHLKPLKSSSEGNPDDNIAPTVKQTTIPTVLITDLLTDVPKKSLRKHIKFCKGICF